MNQVVQQVMCRGFQGYGLASRNLLDSRMPSNILNCHLLGKLKGWENTMQEQHVTA